MPTTARLSARERGSTYYYYYYHNYVCFKVDTNSGMIYNDTIITIIIIITITIMFIVYIIGLLSLSLLLVASLPSEKGEVLIRGVGPLQYFSPPNASVQWQPDGLTVRTKKWFTHLVGCFPHTWYPSLSSLSL